MDDKSFSECDSSVDASPDGVALPAIPATEAEVDDLVGQLRQFFDEYQTHKIEAHSRPPQTAQTMDFLEKMVLCAVDQGVELPVAVLHLALLYSASNRWASKTEACIRALHWGKPPESDDLVATMFEEAEASMIA